MIRVTLPTQLRTLAEAPSEVHLEVAGKVTPAAVIDALEQRYPVLRGTIREHRTLRRRPHVRYFACRQDWSHESPDALLPDSVAEGHEPFVILGAMSGG